MDITLRRSVVQDLDILLKLEQKAFPHYQQSPRRTIELSLKSSFQQVWVAEERIEDGTTQPAGSLVLYLYKKTIRIFSIVVDPDYQGKGVGGKLLAHAQEIALEKGAERISLEASVDNRKLIAWYKKAGFESTELLKDYYEEERDGLRMVKWLPEKEKNYRLSNIIVVDDPSKCSLEVDNTKVVSASDYTSNKGLFFRAFATGV
jgi:ribosomal protein S18 acetylase RimI-like enzyme